MSIVNLTPHVVRIYAEDRPDGLDDIDWGLLHTLDPEPRPARLAMIPIGTTYHDDIPVELVEYGHAEDLPSPRDGVLYVVSLALALSLSMRRDDLLVPYREVRNSDGTVIGCRELAQPV
jgi:hypothetical protein